MSKRYLLSYHDLTFPLTMHWQTSGHHPNIVWQSQCELARVEIGYMVKVLLLSLSCTLSLVNVCIAEVVMELLIIPVV